MHGRIPAEAQVAIFPADSSDSESSIAVLLDAGKSFTDSSDSESSGWFAKLARKLWSQKTAAVLAFLTGRRERQCYRYVSGQAEPMASFLVELLRSSDGNRVLEEIMRGSTAAWWQRNQFALAAMPAIEQLRQLQLPLK